MLRSVPQVRPEEFEAGSRKVKVRSRKLEVG